MSRRARMVSSRLQRGWSWKTGTRAPDLPITPDLWIDASRDTDVPAVGEGDESPENFGSDDDLSIAAPATSNRPIWRGADEGWEFLGDDEFAREGVVIGDRGTMGVVGEFNGDSSQSAFGMSHSNGKFEVDLTPNEEGSALGTIRFYCDSGDFGDAGGRAIAQLNNIHLREQFIIFARWDLDIPNDEMTAELWWRTASDGLMYDDNTNTYIISDLTDIRFSIGRVDSFAANYGEISALESMFFPTRYVADETVENTLIPYLSDKWGIT